MSRSSDIAAVQPRFVGRERQLLVEGLVSTFDNVGDSGLPCWVEIEAPSGWGKTRLVQELYAALAARQALEYWPPSIVGTYELDQSDVASRRKRTFPAPGSFRREQGALPEFMWWGIACTQRNSSPINALTEDLDQLHAHTQYLEAAWVALANRSESSRHLPTMRR